MKPSKMILFLLFLFAAKVLLAQEKRVIVIDAGHGGTDFGAIGTNQVKEKDITLRIAKAMLLFNRKVLNNRYDLYLTRYRDTLISLNHRTQLVRALKPDLFISLHCNHAQNENATGIEIYLHSKTNLNTANQKVSHDIGISIVRILAKDLGYRSRGIKRANFHVLRESITICPAVLVEFGFLSNTDEATYLKLEKNYRALAQAVLMSIKI